MRIIKMQSIQLLETKRKTAGNNVKKSTSYKIYGEKICKKKRTMVTFDLTSTYAILFV